MKTLEQIKQSAFEDELKKIAFMPSEQHEGEKKTLGQQWKTIKKHPAGFLGSAYKGQLAGLTAGAVGGAIVSAPFAAFMARKNPRVAVEAGKGLFKSIGPHVEGYKGRVAHHIAHMATGETIGGGVVGMGLSLNKFFDKYKHEK